MPKTQSIKDMKNNLIPTVALIFLMSSISMSGQNIHNIVPWIMPINKNAGSAKVNNQKALENGLSFRPLSDSVKDTYDWWYSDTVSKEQRDLVELNPESVLVKEKAILEKWKAR